MDGFVQSRDDEQSIFDRAMNAQFDHARPDRRHRPPISCLLALLELAKASRAAAL
jgi:hypothetical protein